MFKERGISICTSLFRLAGGVDPVPRQLFEPLVFQVVHWVSMTTSESGLVPTSSKAFLILIASSVEAMSNANDSGIRDLG